MISKEMKEKFAPWMPAAFCAALSLITICTNLRLTVVNHTDTGGWAVVFLCFLPMCFYFVGMAISRTQAQIRDLQRQVDKSKDF
jgi:uncharacterized membrane protein